MTPTWISCRRRRHVSVDILHQLHHDTVTQIMGDSVNTCLGTSAHGEGQTVPWCGLTQAPEVYSPFDQLLGHVLLRGVMDDTEGLCRMGSVDKRSVYFEDVLNTESINSNHWCHFANAQYPQLSRTPLESDDVPNNTINNMIKSIYIAPWIQVTHLSVA